MNSVPNLNLLRICNDKHAVNVNIQILFIWYNATQ